MEWVPSCSRKSHATEMRRGIQRTRRTIVRRISCGVDGVIAFVECHVVCSTEKIDSIRARPQTLHWVKTPRTSIFWVKSCHRNANSVLRFYWQHHVRWLAGETQMSLLCVCVIHRSYPVLNLHCAWIVTTVQQIGTTLNLLLVGSSSISTPTQ
jgi:hypothetical protein